MRSSTTRANTLAMLVAALKSGTLDEAAAQQLYQLGPHAVTLALLAAARRISELQAQTTNGGGPSTPSGMRPIYTKPNRTACLHRSAPVTPGRRAAQRAAHEGRMTFRYERVPGEPRTSLYNAA